MKRELLKNLPYAQLQEEYAAYLKRIRPDLSESTIATYKSDALYLLRNDSSIDFWELLENNDFEGIAKKYLSSTLERISTGNVEANLNGYFLNICRFREFVFSGFSDAAEVKPRASDTIRKYSEENQHINKNSDPMQERD